MSTEGTYVGKYLIKSKIAEGGMGAIYKAKHPTLGRTVILKRLTLRKNSAITERFKREAQLMIDFRNDNIVQVYDHFKEGNSYYIAMEYVDGISLGDLIEKRRYITNEIAMLIFREICKALKYAHNKGVIHRDIKPENVLISNEGEVKLTDFGIATSKDTEDEGLTSAGMTLGTPAYMSPEQIADTKTVDKRADIYSMGVVLYKMVTGKTPFPGNFTPDALAQINKGEYVFPRKINPRITPLIQKVIKKAMHYKPKKRYKDLQSIIDIFSKELKKKYRTQEAINITIKAFLQGKDAEIAGKSIASDTIGTIGKTVKGVSSAFASNFFKIILSIIIIAIIVSGGAYYAYLKGMHYEYFQQNDYGALKISVRVRVKDKNLEDNYVYVSLYELAGKKYSKVTDIDYDFTVQDEKNDEYYTIQSQKLYLKTNNYRIYLNFGNEQFQKDFFLKPRALQKANKDTFESETIGFLYTPPLHLPLKINYKVVDSTNNNDITSEADFEIYANRKWIAWKDFLQLRDYEDILVSGRTHRFRFKKDGYYPVSRKIYVNSHESVMYMEANLSPLPGALWLQSGYEGLEVLLNNSKYYLSGGRYRKYLELQPLSLKKQSILLAPGDYFLTVRKSDSVTNTIRVGIEPGKSTIVMIDYNKDKDSIELDIKS